MGDELRFAYGSLPYSIAIAGYLIKKRHYMGKPWVAVSMIHYCYVAVSVFSSTALQTKWIVIFVGFDAFMFAFYDKLEKMGEFKVFDKTGLLKDFMLYISRNAILVYVIHLMFYRLVQMAKWNW